MKKYPSGAALRRRRVERGLPRYTEKEQMDRLSSSKARLSARRDFIGQIKTTQGCADCGYNDHPAALQFDHLPGYQKTRGVGNMLGCTIESLLSEIAKCEVVCANCHAIRTALRR